MKKRLERRQGTGSMVRVPSGLWTWGLRGRNEGRNRKGFAREEFRLGLNRLSVDLSLNMARFCVSEGRSHSAAPTVVLLS